MGKRCVFQTSWGTTLREWEVHVSTAFNNNMAAPLNNPMVAMVRELILQAAGSVIPMQALEMQKRYMKHRMRKPADMNIRQCVNHLTRINLEELPQLPPFSPTQALSYDELMDIVVYGIPRSWEKEMRQQDFDPFHHNTTLCMLVDFCEHLKGVEDNPAVKNKVTSSKKQKVSKGKPNKSGSKNCMFRESSTHSTEECTTLKKLKNKKDGAGKPKTWEKKAGKSKKFTEEELSSIVKSASKKAVAKAKKEFTSNKTPAKHKNEDNSDNATVESLNNIKMQLCNVDQ